MQIAGDTLRNRPLWINSNCDFKRSVTALSYRGDGLGLGLVLGLGLGVGLGLEVGLGAGLGERRGDGFGIGSGGIGLGTGVGVCAFLTISVGAAVIPPGLLPKAATPADITAATIVEINKIRNLIWLMNIPPSLVNRDSQ